MNVFVTGATGVLGKRAVMRLIGVGHHVSAAIRETTRGNASGAELRAHGATTSVTDLFDARALERAFRGHDAVLNLATHVPTGLRFALPWAWGENTRLRIEASRCVAEAAVRAGARVLIQESVTMLYPDCGADWIDETRVPAVTRATAPALAAEANASRFEGTGRRAIVLRFGMFYGPDSAHTIDEVHAVRAGRSQVIGNSSAYLSSITTDDAAAAVVAALDTASGVYNVVDDVPVTREKYLQTISEQLGVNAPAPLSRWIAVVLGPLGTTLSRSQRVSNHAMKRATGWVPTYPSVYEGWRMVAEAVAQTEHARRVGTA